MFLQGPKCVSGHFQVNRRALKIIIIVSSHYHFRLLFHTALIQVPEFPLIFNDKIKILTVCNQINMVQKQHGHLPIMNEIAFCVIMITLGPYFGHWFLFKFLNGIIIYVIVLEFLKRKGCLPYVYGIYIRLNVIFHVLLHRKTKSDRHAVMRKIENVKYLSIRRRFSYNFKLRRSEVKSIFGDRNRARTLPGSFSNRFL